MSEKLFEQMLKKDVSDHIEKKGGFSYLSWPYAVAELRKADPGATWEVKRFGDVPFMQTDCGFFVEVSVTFSNITLSQIHPVLDNANRPIAKPNSFQINTSIMRCLVKAIALHGLGLYIYAGEDLPSELSGETQQKKSATAPAREAINNRIRAGLVASGCKTAEDAAKKVNEITGYNDYKSLPDNVAISLAENLENPTLAVCTDCKQPLIAGGCQNRSCPNCEPF